MFEHRATVRKLAGSVVVAALLAVPSAEGVAWIEREAEACDDVVPLMGSLGEIPVVAAGLNNTVRGHGGDESDVFAVEVPEAGIVSVELVVAVSAPAEPKLALVDSVCRGTGREWPEISSGSEHYGLTILARSVSRLLLAVREPGTYLFRVAAQDPLLPLGSYRFTTGFVALDLAIFDFQSSPEEEVIQIEPKGDPDDEVIEIDPDSDLWYEVPLLTVPLGKSRGDGRGLCRAAEIDDHADTFICATRLMPGQEVAGEIGNCWGDDVDVFYLILEGSPEETLWTLSVETMGDADTFGGLYDRHGHRLATDDDGGHGGNFRVVKALAPGLYFVRVEGGHSAEAAYALRVAASRW